MNGLDESNIVSGKLRFQGTLDVSFYTIYQHDNMKYKAKFNAKPGLPKVVYIIINILLIIQLVGPCFFVDSTILWDPESVFTKFMKSIGCIWQLWSGKSRIYAGIVFCILVFLFEIVSGVWSGIISKKQVMRKGENYMALLGAKYLRPIFTVLAFSAFPESVYNVKNLNVAVIYIVFFCFVLFMGPFDLYLTSARILVENNPNHEWSVIYPFLTFAVTAVLVIFSASVGFVGKTVQAVFMIICAVIYCLFALFIFFTSPTVKPTFSYITSSLCVTCCIVSLISTIFVFVGGVNPALLLVLFIVLFIVCYIGVTFLNKRKTARLMMIFSQCEENPDEAEEILTRNFKSPRAFINAIHCIFSYWHPFLLTWKPFSIFTQAYPKNAELILLWIRICALFPQEAELFRYLISQYANMKQNNSYLQTSFLNQMIIIQNSRNLESTPMIMKSITGIVKRIEISHSLQFRFWERILQKSVDAFWPNVKSLSSYLDKIDNDIQQMINLYPNNKDIVTLYCSFLQNVKCDFVKYQEWIEKLQQLKEGIPLQPDIGVLSARYFLPEIQQYCSESQLKKQDDISASEFVEAKITEIDTQHLQVKIGLQELVDKSRIGSITLGIIILIIGTILTILAFVWYSEKFEDRYVDDTEQKADFIKSINNGLFNFGYLANYVAMHPLIISKALNICTSATDTSDTCTNLMTKIAPTLYPTGKIIPWTYEPTYPQNIISIMREKLVQIQYTLSNLTHSSGAQSIYKELFIDPFEKGLTPIQDLLRCSVDATSILKAESFNEFQTSDLIIEFDRSVNTVANKLIEYPEKMLQASIHDVGEVKLYLDTYFLLTLFAVLVLIALPFNMTYYLLRIESGLVTLAFTTLPNTAVREIIQNLNGKQNNKNGNANSSNKSFMGASEDTTNDTLLMYFIFFIANAMVIICCLYLYYLSYDYSDDVNNELQKMSSFQHPAIFTLFTLYRFMRAATFDLIPAVGITEDIKSYYTQSRHLEIARSSITRMQAAINNGFWGPQGTAGTYFETSLNIEYFSNILPTFQSSAKPIVPSVFEELVSLDMLNQFDILLKYMHNYHLMAVSMPNIDYYENKFFLPLIYYASTYAGSITFPPFFNTVMLTITESFNGLKTTIKGLIAGVAIVQCLSLLGIIYYLQSKSLLIKKALHMFLFFNHQVILQNQNVMLLLTKRSMRNFEDESSYLDAEKVIENTDEAAVLIDKKMIVTDVNNAFSNCVESKKDDLIGKQITDVLRSSPDHLSIESILLKLNDVFKGLASPSFKEKITVLIPNGKEKDVYVNVICLTPNGTATENDFHEICAFAFIIDDQTEQRRIEQKIYNEKQKITEMLSKVLPASVIDDLQKGTDTISLSVQSASVGFIEVRSAKSFDQNDFNAPFKFLSVVFNALDEMIKDFPQLTKIRTSSYTYEYAGGLFGSVNKPDKHAEEATRFALKVISSSQSISEKVGSGIEFKIGLSTGGPLVAGVISLNRPEFHLIGPTVDFAHRMKTSGVFNQVQVTRAVYELIYAYNFKVTERGDIDTGGGKILRTYVINP